MTRALVGYTYKCSDGTSFTDTDSFKAIPLLSNRTFRASYDTGAIVDVTVPGGTVRWTGSIDGIQNKRGTKVTGTARFTFVVTPPLGEAVTCDTGTIRYGATD